MVDKAPYNPVAFNDSLPADGWVKSSFSGADPQNCVQWQPLPCGGMALRDSVFPEHGAQKFTGPEWQSFLAAVIAGEAGSIG